MLSDHSSQWTAPDASEAASLAVALMGISLLVPNVTLYPAQYVGGALIVAAVVLLQRAKL